MTTTSPTTSTQSQGGRSAREGGQYAREGVSLRAGGPSPREGAPVHGLVDPVPLAFFPTSRPTFERGLAFYRAGKVHPHPLFRQVFHIVSRLTTYTVDLSLPSCGCGAFKWAPTQACKHMVAAGAKAVELGRA